MPLLDLTEVQIQQKRKDLMNEMDFPWVASEWNKNSKVDLMELCSERRFASVMCQH